MKKRPMREIPHRSFISFLLSFLKISEDLLAGYDSDKRAAVIGHGKEVLHKQTLHKLLHPCRDLHGRIAVGLEDIGYMKILAFFHACSADIGVFIH